LVGTTEPPIIGAGTWCDVPDVILAAEVDLARFNLNSLVALDAVLRHATLTGAARSINLSQPAMSIALKRLRETFEDELVRYDRGRTTYTTLAEELRPRIADILARSWGLIELARQFDPQSFRGTITMCAAQLTLGFFYAPLIAALAMSAPNLSIRAVPYPPPHGVSDHIDLYILPQWLIAPDSPSRPLFVEVFSCLAPPNHLAGLGFDEDTYIACDHAALPPGEEELFWPPDSAARALLAKRRIHARAAQVEALRFLVVRNELVATLPMRLAHQCSAVSTAVPINAPAALTAVTLVAQAAPGRGGEPALRWLIDEIGRLTASFNPPEPAGYRAD
jgi:LysR family nod box-dependent transcriptional activator